MLDALRVDDRRSLIFRRNEDIAAFDEPIECAYLIRSGWACCHWRVSDGRRQILHFLLEGDTIGVLPLLNRSRKRRHKVAPEAARSGYTITALTELEAVPIGSDLAEIALVRSPGICDTLQEQTIEGTNRMLALRLTTLGQGDARERMAVLFQELWLRQIKLGRANDSGFPLPINQAAIGDALGLTAVHVSRTLGKFEEDGILSASRDGPRHIRVYDPVRLRRIAAAIAGPTGRGPLAG